MNNKKSEKERILCARIGKAFRARRLELNLTQEQVGLKMGCCTRNYQYIEIGIHGISLYQFMLICKVLDTTWFEILEQCRKDK